MLFLSFAAMLNVFKINITPYLKAVKREVEHVQYVTVSIIYGSHGLSRESRESGIRNLDEQV
jgi:hypothetical protein